MAQIIDVYGNVTEVEPTNGTDFTLTELQNYLGGVIEILPLKERVMVLYRDAHLAGREENRLATREVTRVHGTIGRIIGPALICTQEEIR